MNKGMNERMNELNRLPLQRSILMRPAVDVLIIEFNVGNISISSLIHEFLSLTLPRNKDTEFIHTKGPARPGGPGLPALP